MLASAFKRVALLGLRARVSVEGMAAVVRYLRNPAPDLTVGVLRRYGATIGAQARFKGSLFLDNVWEDEHSAGDLRHLVVGDNCYIGDSVYFDLAHEVVIESNVVVSARAALVTHQDCNRSPFLSGVFARRGEGIRLGSGAWVGFGATILAGSVVGADAAIAAHALVRDDVPPRTLSAGVPARRVRGLSPGPSSEAEL